MLIYKIICNKLTDGNQLLHILNKMYLYKLIQTIVKQK